MAVRPIPMRSKDIIAAFLNSGREMSRVNAEVMGRTVPSLYAGLHVYLSRNRNLDVKVRLIKGEVYLLRSEATNPSGIFD